MSAIRRPLAAVVVVAASALALGLPAGAVSTTKTCKLLKAAKVAKVLDAPAAVDPDGGDGPASGIGTCSYDVGPGLGEPGGALVIVTYYTGALADNTAAEFKSRATSLSKRVVWEPNLEVAYVVKKGKLVGVNIAYTSSDPPATELQDEAAALARAAAART